MWLCIRCTYIAPAAARQAVQARQVGAPPELRAEGAADRRLGGATIDRLSVRTYEER